MNPAPAIPMSTEGVLAFMLVVVGVAVLLWLVAAALMLRHRTER